MPAEYIESAVPLQEGQPWASPATLADTIASLRYAPGGSDRGSFSLVETDGAVTLSVGLVVDDLRLDVRLVSDDTWTIESLALVGEDDSSTVDAYVLYPASHHAATPEEIERACDDIEIELVQELERHLAAGRWREAERLRRRVSDDVAMLRAEGWCAGAENYARHLSGRAEHEAPATLIDYFPDDDWLLVVDEAHVAVPQLRGMHAGDRARKSSLVENGFRLKSALDNRPLTASEFWARVPQAVLATATPSDDVLDMCDRSPENVASLVVRPTGVVDPSVTVVNASKAGGLEDHLLAAVSKAEGRALVTCLTKRSAEALADFLTSHGIPAAWLHADLDSQKRLKVLDALRRGDLKAVVGCNLLREGLDLPQVSLVAIVGAEKRGYLRSATSLIQTIGRAARHVNGEVLLYTDDGFVSDSMHEAIEETERRRSIQLRYNDDHGVTPRGAAAAGGDANDALAELLGPSRGGPGGGGAMRELPVFEDPTDEALHVALREWRKATAAANRKRPFRVFPERTLQDLVAKKPTTTSELKKVWGLGPARLARHGDEVLAVVREYVVSR